MIEAIGADLKNVVYFKEATIDYTDNCGLVVVSGSNLDSRLSKKQNNGAGKSLSFSVIPNIVFESTPLAAQKRSRKDIMGKGSEASFKIRNNGHEYEVIQTPSKYIILRDGVDLEARTLNIQREWIQKIFPLTEDEFYSYVYLQSQRNLEFQVGTPRSRLSYITSVWRLDQYDVMRKYFEKKLSDVKTAQTEFDVLTTQLMQITRSLEKLGWSKAKQRQLDEANEVVQNLSDTVKELQTNASKLRGLKEQISFYKKTKKALSNVKKKIKYSKAELKEQYKLIQDAEEYTRAMQQYEKLTKRWTEKLEEIGEVEFGPVEKARLKKNEERLEEASGKLDDLKVVRRTHKELHEAFVELPKIKAPKLDDYVKLAAKAKRDVLEFLEEELGILNTTISLESLLHEHEDGECPTCHQTIDVAKLKKNITVAKKRKEEVRDMMKAHKVRVGRARIKDQLSKLNFDESVYESLKEKISKLGSTIEKLEEQKESARRYAEYREELNSIKKPKAPKSKPKISEEEIDEQVELLSELKRFQERLSEFEEEPTDEGIDEKLKRVERKLSKVESHYTEAFSVTVELGSKRSEAKLLQKQSKELNAQLEGMRPLIEQRDMLKTLTQAYGNKGLKLHAVNQILLQLEQNLNRFSSLIFAEPFKFEVTAKDDGVHVIVDRGHNKVSDVRQLSGAESDSFRLLYMMASLVMVEDSRRTNFVVLDEPDSHMDDITRSLFIERYIPFLRTLVPHVFLITPNSKHLYSNCDYMTIVKKNGVSKIVKGQ